MCGRGERHWHRHQRKAVQKSMRLRRGRAQPTRGARGDWGLPPKEGPLSEGYYTMPTIFANVANDWRLAREEIFGPVLVALPWTNEADAIRMANDSHYGLLPTSGRTTSAAHFAPRTRSRPAGYRSIRASAKLPVSPMAVTRKAASVESSHSKECSRATRKGRTSRSI